MLKAIDSTLNNLEVDTTAAKVVAQYLHELRTITIIRMLVPLIIASQQHRGANLALFEGNFDFKGMVESLQNEINNRFITLETINKEFAKTISDNEIQQLRHEWETVCEWYGGSALENFKLHSHFIEQQMKLVWSLSQRANFFKSDMQRNEDNLQEDDLLIWFILREAPELIELIAKIRGLATHACVLGFCDDEHYSWLKYLLVLLNQKKEKFREHSNTLQSYALKDVPAIIDLHIKDIKIVQLIQRVNDEILNQTSIDVDSYNIFDMATEIIDSYSDVFEQGLGYVRNKINKQLDNWHLEI